MVFTFSHSPRRFSFHKLTLLSPPLTAKTFPLKLQLTLHRTTSKFKTLLFHCPGCAGSEVQMRTVLSCDAEAIYDFCKTVGDHATSRTQSVCPVNGSCSCLYDWLAWSKAQILNTLSLPPVTNLRIPPTPAPLLTRLPGVVEGAHETELTPMP